MKISKTPTIAFAVLSGLVAVSVNSAKADDTMSTNVVSTNATPDYTTAPAYTAPTVTTNNEEDASMPFYHANEFSVDLFGVGAVSQTTIDNITGDRLRHRGQLGEGVGINYFFCRYIGVSGDTYSHDWYHNTLLDSAEGNVVLRLPIKYTGLAPYIYGGAGHDFKGVQQTIEEAGGGLEFRFIRHVGIFADARYVFAEQTENYAVARAGLRFSF